LNTWFEAKKTIELWSKLCKCKSSLWYGSQTKNRWIHL